jgi:hypothetical protein
MKNPIVKSTMFPNHNIYKYTLISPDGKTYKQIYRVVTDKRRHSNIGDCDTDHYLVVAKVRERLSVSNQQCRSLMWRAFMLGREMM